jgi:hypothetical protein
MRKTFTKLSIAAVVLLAGAIPCFAQNQSIAYAADAKSTTAVGSGLELALNKQSSAISPVTGFVLVESKSVADTKHLTAPTLTPAAFKTSERFVKAKDNFSGYAQPIWSTDTSFNPKSQFRNDESNAQASRNRVTFVPSRGPKVPW